MCSLIFKLAVAQLQMGQAALFCAMYARTAEESFDDHLDKHITFLRNNVQLTALELLRFSKLVIKMRDVISNTDDLFQYFENAVRNDDIEDAALYCELGRQITQKPFEDFVEKHLQTLRNHFWPEAQIAQFSQTVDIFMTNGTTPSDEMLTNCMVMNH